jgi:hypothetical protein
LVGIREEPFDEVSLQTRSVETGFLASRAEHGDGETRQRILCLSTAHRGSGWVAFRRDEALRCEDPLGKVKQFCVAANVVE